MGSPTWTVVRGRLFIAGRQLEGATPTTLVASQPQHRERQAWHRGQMHKLGGVRRPPPVRCCCCRQLSAAARRPGAPPPVQALIGASEGRLLVGSCMTHFKTLQVCL